MSAAPSSSGFAMMSPHRAVLEATPDDDAGKVRLVEELQSRGRAAVGAKSWMDAKLLYEKCLTITDCSAVDNKKKAVFHSNLSLVESGMGEFEKARVAAEAGTKDDPKYVKAWWRLGQALLALHRPQEALDAFSKAKQLDPTNKALSKLVEKTKKQVEEEAALMKEVDANDGADGDKDKSSNKITTSIPTPSVKTKTTNASSSSINTSSNNSSTPADDEDDSKLFTKSEPVRGYKVVNGKKTSYFHNELDEKSRELIGDIAPKKIKDPTSANPTAAAAASATKQQGTSVWNTGGTWEEKNVTEWAKQSLTELLLQTTYTLPPSSPAPGAVVSVEKVSKLDGHASVAVVRGKTRFIYEFSCKLDWQLDKEDDELNCKGTLAIPDIDGTIAIGEGYDIHDFTIASVSNNSVKPVVDRFVHRGGFHEALNEKIDDWVRHFKKVYGPKDA
uniref:Activator of Hsp90 ATPase AHSA1-like N-terminal domain-containing protein n=1 Tax=Pseudo-nitzschia australis TaxID=44445 RepID=A0A7S4ARV6_9STRA